MKKQSNQSQTDEQKQLSLKNDRMEKLFKELGLTIDDSMEGKAFVMPYYKAPPVSGTVYTQEGDTDDIDDESGAIIRNGMRKR